VYRASDVGNVVFEGWRFGCKLDASLARANAALKDMIEMI
jgi:hypothetical protein